MFARCACLPVHDIAGERANRPNREITMLAGKRAVRVGDQLLREIADLLMRRVRDPRVKGATLTGVELSDDLKHAKVYYSVLGSPVIFQGRRQEWIAPRDSLRGRSVLGWT